MLDGFAAYTARVTSPRYAVAIECLKRTPLSQPSRLAANEESGEQRQLPDGGLQRVSPLLLTQEVSELASGFECRSVNRGNRKNPRKANQSTPCGRWLWNTL